MRSGFSLAGCLYTPNPVLASTCQSLPLRTGAVLLSMIGRVCVRSGLPVAECLRNPYTVLATTRRGGHCAHLQVRQV